VLDANKTPSTHQIVFHLFDGFVWDRKPELFLGDCKIKPQLPPCPEPMLVIVVRQETRDGQVTHTAGENRWAISLLAYRLQQRMIQGHKLNE